MSGERLVDAVATAFLAMSNRPWVPTCEALASALEDVVTTLLERGWSTDDALCAWNLAEGLRSGEPNTATLWRARLDRGRAAGARESARHAMAAMPCRMRMVAKAAAEALALAA